MKGVVFYRVNLTDGILLERRPPGHYAGSPELGVTVFSNLFAAKRALRALCKAEIERVSGIRKRLRGFYTRRELEARLASISGVNQPSGEAHRA